jgi:SAM-dependent methyltransferase
MLFNRFGGSHILELLPGILLGAVLVASCIPAYSQTPPPPAVPAQDPPLPPIDCPLRSKGIDPGQLRPFEEVEEYIAFLEGPDRALWQKPDEVVAALNLEGNETVVDLGSGSGCFTFRLANALPGGRVIAADIEPEMIRHVHRKAMTEGVRNVRAELIKPADPALPDGVDLVFVCDVLLHVTDRQAWLGNVAGTMRPGARLVLIEFREGDLPQGPPESMKIPRNKILELATGAGLVLTSEEPDLLPYQVYLVFQKP